MNLSSNFRSKSPLNITGRSQHLASRQSRADIFRTFAPLVSHPPATALLCPVHHHPTPWSAAPFPLCPAWKTDHCRVAVVAVLHLRRRRALECPSPPLSHRPSPPLATRLLCLPRAAQATPLPPLNAATAPTAPLRFICTENAKSSRHCRSCANLKILTPHSSILQLASPTSSPSILKPILAISRQARASPSITDEPLPLRHRPQRG